MTLPTCRKLVLANVPAMAAALLLLAACDSPRPAGKPPARVSADAKKILGENLPSLASPVTLRLFRGDDGDHQGDETQALVDHMARTSSKVIVAQGELDDAARSDLEVDHGPVMEFRSAAGGVMRYYGFPERKEVAPFVDGVLLASGAPFNLSPRVATFLGGLEREVVIRIFTTPD